MKPFTSHIGQLCLSFLLFLSCNSIPDNLAESDEKADLFPDYTETMIPVNIAPLNFIIREPGDRYFAEFTSQNGEYKFTVSSRDSVIRIPEKKWRKLLEASLNSSYTLGIVTKLDGKWKRYKTVSNRVSADKIDPYITYRRINPGMILWNDMDITQRSLEHFEESNIISNQNTEKKCMHCHTFHERDPESFMLHFRVDPNGTLIKKKDQIKWLSTQTDYTLSKFTYPSWHPGGRYLAFSTNRIHQNFFAQGDRINHVRDDASDIVVYDLDSNLVFTCPELATLDFENIPAWSAKGDYLYFISSPAEYKNMADTAEKYDLKRIAFDPVTKAFGEVDTLISGTETGLSVSFPQASPDGKFLVFCMADYGYFNINNKSSDLYLMNLSDLSYKRLDAVNSEHTESWPTWSDNGRWLMFSSKRTDGLITIPHVAYVDRDGKASKAFPIPFEDPETILTRITNLNRPVFMKGKFQMTEAEILKTVYQDPVAVVFDTLGVDVDALSGPTMQDTPTAGTAEMYSKN